MHRAVKKEKRASLVDPSEEEYNGSSSSEHESDYNPRASKRKRVTGPRAKSPQKRVSPTKEDTLRSGPARTHSRSEHVLAQDIVAPIQNALSSYYAGAHETRGMPWRKPWVEGLSADERAQRAYEVWISEVMLQQTQVAAVVPYYNRWMDKFPTLPALAASDINTVNAIWKGLGYYSRAARLLAGAQKCVRDLGGRLPSTAHQLQKEVPGIGRYSAGAIASVAYGEQVGVLDGNITRLLTRLLGLHAPVQNKSAQDILWAAADGVVQGAHRPGDINQALIEVGATVCRPTNPACEECPVRSWCGARKLHGESTGKDENEVADIEDQCTICLPGASAITSYPLKLPKKKAREELDVVCVVEAPASASSSDRLFLMVTRPEGGLLAGLQDFPALPNVPHTDNPENHDAGHVRAVLQPLLASPHQSPSRSKFFPSGGPGDMRITHAGDVLHVFSHIRKTYRVLWVVLDADAPPALKAPLVSESPTKRKRKDVALSAKDTAVVQAKWVKMEDVADANVGTGVLKVWEKARSAWANKRRGGKA